MVCPTCKKVFARDSSDALPFCSERCRTIDLGRWLDEEHGLPSVPDPEDDEVPEKL
ncbi:DNA gyrase inhibitor YacG [Aeoliella sp.]|uniref:DNA gyrase inhibitor YacG n=1 Tax=Aeoliella sp. TaxID=2795800 RepID=UPI003CCC0956